MAVDNFPYLFTDVTTFICYAHRKKFVQAHKPCEMIKQKLGTAKKNYIFISVIRKMKVGGKIRPKMVQVLSPDFFLHVHTSSVERFSENFDNKAVVRWNALISKI
jgi:hypothetical protein